MLSSLSVCTSCWTNSRFDTTLTTSRCNVNSSRSSDAYIRQKTKPPSWIAACTAPSHYLNQRWHILYCTTGNRFQWILHQNTIFMQINYFENISSAKWGPSFLSNVLVQNFGVFFAGCLNNQLTKQQLGRGYYIYYHSRRHVRLPKSIYIDHHLIILLQKII